MSLFDLFEKLYEREVPDEDSPKFAQIFERQDFESMIHGINHHLEFERRVNKISHRRDLEVIYQHDIEIYSAWDKRTQAVKNTHLKLESESNELKTFFENQIMPYEDQLKEDFLWAVPYGYNVEQIIYKEDRSGEVEGFQRENFWRFEPQKDGIHVILKNSGSSFFMNNLNEFMPYGKWVLTTHKGSAVKPAGESLFARLYLPWLWRCSGMDEWVRFAEKHGRGFLIGTTPSADDVHALQEAIDNAVKGAGFAVAEGTNLQYLQTTSQGDLYKKLDDQLVNMMLRAILGETQTSKMEERGSSASTGVHNEVRIEKTKADCKLIEKSINETIRQIAAVNEIEGDLPKARIHLGQGLENERAERDIKLKTTGVKFKKDYFVKNYGLKEEEFEIVEDESPLGGLFKGDKGLDFAEALPKQEFGLDYIEEVIELLEKQNLSPMKDSLIFKMVKEATSYEDLREKTGKLFEDADDSEFVDTLSKALYHMAIVGAAEASKDNGSD